MRTIDGELEFTYKVLGEDVEVVFLPYRGQGFECRIMCMGEQLGRGVGAMQEALAWARISAVENR